VIVTGRRCEAFLGSVMSYLPLNALASGAPSCLYSALLAAESAGGLPLGVTATGKLEAVFCCSVTALEPALSHGPLAQLAEQLTLNQ
jgi:hypothetical protein